MQAGRRLLLPATLLAVVLLLPAAFAQEPGPAEGEAPASTLPPGVSVHQGGEPGTVRVTINGVDVDDAASVADALAVDPRAAANVSISMTPPEGVTWEVRAIHVGLLVSGPGSEPPSALSRAMPARTTLPPGFTVVVNRTLDLSSLKDLGAGVFLMQARVEDASGTELYARTFYVHVTGNPFLTVAGAAVTAMSVATGYGLWRLVSDLREFHETWRRHRRERAARLDEGKGIVGTAKATLADRDRLERRQAIRWTATGLGLGAVGLSWAQFLGYVAFDAMSLVLTTLEAGALTLGVALLLIALRRRMVRAGQKERVRTLVPTGPEPAPAREAPGEAPRAR